MESDPPTGKRFATTQSHWFRVRDGKVAEHWANREQPARASVFSRAAEAVPDKHPSRDTARQR